MVLLLYFWGVGPGRAVSVTRPDFGTTLIASHIFSLASVVLSSRDLLRALGPVCGSLYVDLCYGGGHKRLQKVWVYIAEPVVGDKWKSFDHSTAHGRQAQDRVNERNKRRLGAVPGSKAKSPLLDPPRPRGRPNQGPQFASLVREQRENDAFPVALSEGSNRPSRDPIQSLREERENDTFAFPWSKSPARTFCD